MLELKLRCEVASIVNNSKLISEYMTYGVVDKSDETKHRIYFPCALEKPVRWFTISHRNVPTYITCNMFVDDMHIVCKPMNENLIHDVLKKRLGDAKKIVLMSGTVANREYPKNEQPIEIQLIVDKDVDSEKNEIFFVERVQFYLEQNTVPNVSDYVELDSKITDHKYSAGDQKLS